MGVDYYLLREDTHEVYDLGKAYGWGEALISAAGVTGVVTTCPTPPLVFTVEHLYDIVIALDANWHKRRWHPDDIECPTTYHHDVATDVIDWAQGQPVVCTSEFDARMEWDSDYHYPAVTKGGWRKLRVTGSRFAGEMDELAEKRRAQRAVKYVMGGGS